MRCFNHPSDEAVGVCKACGKGLCKQCAVEKDGFLFCAAHAKAAPKVVEEIEEEEAPRPAAKKIVPKVKPRPIEPKVLLPVRPSSTITPALVGGVLTGLVVGIPFINLLCPIWLALCGLSAGYVLVLKASSEYKQRGYIRPIDGAMVGALSGFFAANAGLVLNLFLSINLWSHIVNIFSAVGADVSTSGLVTQIVAFDPNLDLPFLVLKYLTAIIAFPLMAAIGGVIAARLTR